MGDQTAKAREAERARWLVFIHDGPCLLTERNPTGCRGRIEMVHVKGGTNRKNLPLVGNTFRMCSGHHHMNQNSLHTMGEKSWEAYWGISRVQEALKLKDLFSDWTAPQ